MAENSPKWVQAIKAKHGDDHFSKIGSLGGKASTKGGFAANRELASQAGKIGGKVSRRGKKIGGEASS